MLVPKWPHVLCVPLICSHHCSLNFVCSWLWFCISFCLCMTHIIRGVGSVCILVCPCVPRFCIIKSFVWSVYMTPDVRQVFQHIRAMWYICSMYTIPPHCCPPLSSLGFLNWQIFAVPVLLLPIRLPFSLKHVAECEVSYMQLQHALVQYTPQDGLYKRTCHKVVCSCWCILHSSWFKLQPFDTSWDAAVNICHHQESTCLCHWAQAVNTPD
jgi:hypothetical protein